MTAGGSARFWENQNLSLIKLEAAARNSLIFAGTQAAHMRDLGVLLDQHGVKLRRFDDEILRSFGKLSAEVVAELGASDPFTQCVYESFVTFRRASQRWLNISNRAYLNLGALAFPV